MADGNLTLGDFWKLSPEERLARCGELSDADAYGLRITMPPGPAVYIPCNDCIHRFTGRPACEAFPEGLVADHIRAVMKNPEISCGGSYHFLRKES